MKNPKVIIVNEPGYNYKIPTYKIVNDGIENVEDT